MRAAPCMLPRGSRRSASNHALHSGALRSRGLDGAPFLHQNDTRQRHEAVELGRRIGLSAPAVAERVSRLETSGVIAGYGAHIPPARVGLPVSAFVRIQLRASKLEEIFDLARAHGAVSECHRVTGSDDVIMRVRAASVDRLEQYLDEFLDYGQITTSIVLSSAVEGRPIREQPEV